MKINYIRNLMASYMVLEQKEEPADWEKEMIRHIKIEGMIFADYVGDNGKNQLWYDISGKQALEAAFETVHLNHEMLCTLLMGIYEILERLEAFLLRPEGLLLHPECIFFDNTGQQVYFCYCPGQEGTLPEMFLEFMEYLLAQLDHADSAAVELAYNLYERAVKEGFCLKELKDFLCMDYERETEEDVENLQEPDRLGKRTTGDRGEEWAEERKEAGREACRREKTGKKAARKEMFGKEAAGKEVQGTGAAGKKISWIDEISGKIEQKIAEIKGMFSVSRKKKKEKPEEHFVFEPDEEQEVRQSRPTVLLSELAKTPEGLLRYEGHGEGSDLRIEEVPFVIGSDMSCDGYIPSSTVSRKHAKITRKEDIYFIEDLNSSNGTSVGGELLNYRTKMSLEKNEIVMFADEKFRFI